LKIIKLKGHTSQSHYTRGF